MIKVKMICAMIIATFFVSAVVMNADQNGNTNSTNKTAQFGKCTDKNHNGTCCNTTSLCMVDDNNKDAKIDDKSNGTKKDATTVKTGKHKDCKGDCKSQTIKSKNCKDKDGNGKCCDKKTKKTKKKSVKTTDAK